MGAATARRFPSGLSARERPNWSPARGLGRRTNLSEAVSVLLRPQHPNVTGGVSVVWQPSAGMPITRNAPERRSESGTLPSSYRRLVLVAPAKRMVPSAFRSTELPSPSADTLIDVCTMA